MSEKTKKKFYQKWWVWVIGIILLVLIWVVGSNTIDQARTKEIPNVMSINYTEAEKVLNEKGFKVTAIETDASSILANDIDNRSVKKGEVFKINNTTDPDYTYGTTKDKKIIIYYAKDDYTYEKAIENNSSETKSTESPKTNAPESTATAASNSSTSDWRQFLKDYEEWVDSYVEFMKKYKNNPTDASLLTEYSKFMTDTTEWSKKAQKYQDELQNLSAEDLSEYMKSVTSILEKINSVGA